MSQVLEDPRVRRGMEQQLRLRQERLEAGEVHLGWKVGFGSPEAMARLKIDAPLVGFLTDRVRLPSGAEVSIAGWERPALEPEIAVHMGRDLGRAPNREAARAAIGALGPAIELADVSPPPQDVEAILGGNIYNRHVILGKGDPSRASGLLDGLVGRVFRDGREAASTANPQALTGDLIDIVRHVADLLAGLDLGLKAGDVVITGSIVPLVWLEGEEEIRFHLEPVDEIAVRVAPRPAP